tara:strand:+ start:252 stop:545 length:294 start_codon:yes stop_codon:yes gene_type:complete
MVKALMIVMMVSGAEYANELPSMEACMQMKETVVAQEQVEDATCLPRMSGGQKFREMYNPIFDFLEFIQRHQNLRGCSEMDSTLHLEPCENYYPPKP